MYPHNYLLVWLYSSFAETISNDSVHEHEKLILSKHAGYNAEDECKPHDGRRRKHWIETQN